ncbi:hypothetical protein [Micromonospora tulbaghiae]
MTQYDPRVERVLAELRDAPPPVVDDQDQDPAAERAEPPGPAFDAAAVIRAARM